LLDETILILLHARKGLGYMYTYFLSRAKADLLPTDGGSSARSEPP